MKREKNGITPKVRLYKAEGNIIKKKKTTTVSLIHSSMMETLKKNFFLI